MPLRNSGNKKHPVTKTAGRLINPNNQTNAIKLISNKTLILIVIIIIIGSAASYYFQEKNSPEKASFSELYFLNPDKLPQNVRMNSFYDFSYAVKSHEKNPVNYELTTTYELFRLYDITEGLYSCLSPFRHKVYLEWNNISINKSNENKSGNNSDDELGDNPIPLMIIKPSNDVVKWMDKHSFYFTFSKLLGNGSLIIFYSPINHSINDSINNSNNLILNNHKNNNDAFNFIDESGSLRNYLFKIRITSNGEIYYNGVFKDKLVVNKQNNKVKINYNDGALTFFYNNKLLFKQYVKLVEGQYGFLTKKLLVGLSRIRIQHYARVDVPDKENIWIYELSDKTMNRVLQRIRNKMVKKATLTRFYNIKETESAGYDNQTTITKNITENHQLLFNSLINASNESLLIRNLSSFVENNSDYSLRPNFWLRTTKKNDSLIPWNHSLINISFKTPEENASYNIIIGDEVLLRITNKLFYFFIRKNNNYYLVDSVKGLFQNNDKSAKKNNHLIIISDNNKISFLIKNNNKTINKTYSLRKSLYNQPIRSYQKDTFNDLDFRITHNINSCFRENYDFCNLILAPSKFRMRFPKKNLESYAHQIVNKKDLAQLQELSNQSDEKGNKPEKNVFINKELLRNSNYTKTIPSTRLSLDGPVSLITNESNYSLSTSLIYLDGRGLLSIALESINKTLFKASIDFKNNLVIINVNQSTIRKELILDRNASINWTPVTLSIINNEVVSLKVGGGDPVFKTRIPLVNASKHFVFEINETYFQIRGLSLRKNNKAFSIPLIDNPCQLKSIYKGIIRLDNFTLETGDERIFNDYFKINHFFDYAKISVALLPEKLNASKQEIHFWVVRE